MHAFLVIFLILAPGCSAIGAIALAMYGVVGWKPGWAYAVGSILCAIAAPVLCALSLTMADHGSSVWFAENLRVSAWFFGVVYVVIGVPSGIAYAWDRYDFYPQRPY